jgi:hypothetical protein
MLISAGIAFPFLPYPTAGTATVTILVSVGVRKSGGCPLWITVINRHSALSK